MKYLVAALFALTTTSTLLVSSLPINNTNDGVFESKLYPNLKVNFKTPDLCDPTVKQIAAFGTTGDRIKSSASHVTNLLNNNIPVLMYAGDADFICTHYGIQAWAEQLEFENSQEFRNDKLKPWSMGGKEVGIIQQGDGLTYLRVYEAGHLVPTDQPEAALKMFTDHIQFNLN